jgi:hypothetical protein
MTYQTLPRILIQEAHSNIERSSTPALKTVRISQRVTRLLRDVDHISGTQTSGEQRLVSITPGSVHDERSGILADSLGEGFGTVLDDNVAPSDLARESGVERRAVGVIPVLELGNDDFGLEAWFSLRSNYQRWIKGARGHVVETTYSLTLDGASIDGKVSKVGE